MATMRCELVAPERVLFSGEVDAVMLPGLEGDMTVLPGHAPLMTLLKAGIVVITNHVNDGTRVFVRGGFAEINQTGVTILAERASPADELSPAKIEAEILEIQTRRDASDDYKAREAADAAIAQLQEVKAALAY